MPMTHPSFVLEDAKACAPNSAPYSVPGEARDNPKLKDLYLFQKNVSEECTSSWSLLNQAVC